MKKPRLDPARLRRRPGAAQPRDGRALRGRRPGNALDVVSAWKDALLALGLVLVWRNRGFSFRLRPRPVDWLAIGYGAFVVALAIVPQHVLGGGATHRGVVLGVRHDLLPVAAYFFGRGLDLTTRDLRRLGVTIIAAASAVAAFGLIDVYAIPLSWWRHSGAPDWFSKQLGFTYKGLSNLPQNFVYNFGKGGSSGGWSRRSSRRSPPRTCS